jgi:phage baseplate assembly protein gpV
MLHSTFFILNSAQAATVGVRATGQTLCYSTVGATILCTGTGQDGELRSGVAWPPPRFSSNGDQTVTDNLSGLIWTEDANPAAVTKTWQGALDYITGLNSSNHLGYNDWRLPSVRELRTLPDYSLADSSAWLSTQGFFNVQAKIYWSSTTYAGYASNAWLVGMDSGNSSFASKTDYYYVWPVHDGQLGTCGTSDKGTFTIAPTTNLCTTGTASVPTGTGPWYWTCEGQDGGTTASCTAYSGSPSTTNSTKAKVYLGAGDDNFTVSNSGAILYGSTGNNEVTIASGVTGVILDQNIERINFSDPASNYTFKQTGNMINVYDSTGTTLVVKAPIQGDTDGTLLSFNNNVASALLTGGGIMTLGGVAVDSSTARPLTPPTSTSLPSPTNITKAKVFLIAEDNFTVSNSGATLYGNSGKGTVTISDGIADVLLDQNIGRINFSGASSSYTFKQTGNIINVCDTNGTTLIVKAPVQGDKDGTVLSFGNGTASASVKLSGGVMTLGGIVVSPGAACGLSPILIPPQIAFP